MDIKNFALIKGEDAIIEKGSIKIREPKKTKEEGKSVVKNRPPFEVRSDFHFTNGTIECKFKTNHYSTGILFLFNSPVDEGLAIGLSKGQESFMIAKGRHQLTSLCEASSLRNYKLSEEHNLKIEIIGSSAKLFVDNILICSTSAIIKESTIEIRFNSLGNLEIYDIKSHAIKPEVFVVMQFSKEYNELFEDVIKPITEAAGFHCVRADELYTSTPILKDIIESIEKSAAIIAEITPDNPNVFYEIGYSHAINKPTILLCDKKREKLPFDISGFRTLFYENTIAGKRKVEENLKKYLESIK